jgi:hypothetical protein
MLEDYIKKLERENKLLNKKIIDQGIKTPESQKISIINAQLREEINRLKKIIQDHGITNDT